MGEQGEDGVGVPTFFIGRKKVDPRCLFDLVAQLRRWKPDLIVLSGPKSMVLGGVAARILDVPVSAHLNNTLPVPELMRRAQRRVLAGSTAIAVSKAVRAWASTYYGLPPERLEVLHPGFDLTAFPAAAETGQMVRSRLGIPPDAPVIALIGRLVVAQKGQNLMLQAMPTLLQRHPEAVLLMAGDGPDRRYLESLVQDLGLDRAVRMLGHREDVAEILAAADATVVPSTCEEGFGLMVVEAWAAGVPVVAFGGGGLGELVRHHETGLLVTKGDVTGLASATSALLGDPDEARRVARAGQKEVARFSVDHHVTGLADFYARIVSDFRRAKALRLVPDHRPLGS